MLGRERIKKWSPYILVILLYSLSFFILTYPLIKNFGSGIIGYQGSDAPIFFWNAWFWKQKLLNWDWSYFTNLIFFPLYPSVLLHTNTQVQGLLATIIGLVTGNSTLGFNLVFWFSTVAGAFFAFLFFNLKTKNTIASFLAGQYFGFQHLFGIYSLFGTQNVLSFWYLPASLYFFELFLIKAKKNYLFWLAVILSLAFYNELIVFLFSIATIFLYGLGVMVLEKKKIKTYLIPALLVVVIFFVLSLPKILAINWKAGGAGDTPTPTLMDVDYYHSDIINLFRPSVHHLIGDQLGRLGGNFALYNGNAFLGFSFFLVLFIWLLYYKKHKSSSEDKNSFLIYSFGAVMIFLLACGPYLHLFGYATGIVMPHWFIFKLWSGINNLRVPPRWLFVFIFFIAGILSLWLKNIFEHTTKQMKIFLSLVIYSLLIFDCWFVPKNIIFTTPDSPVFEKIVADKNGSVLEVPVLIASGQFNLNGSEYSSLLRQTWHQHQQLGGMLSRLPFAWRDYYQQAPVLKYFINYETTLADQADLEKDNINNFVKVYDLRYIILDKSKLSISDKAGKSLLEYINNKLKFKVYFEDDKYLVFIVK
ncbi:MAG: hypothetical protein WCT11_01515 [Candidatus Magasanikbacteria bacterium]